MQTLWLQPCSGGSAVSYKLRRKLLSQNFLYNRTLVKSLVRGSSVGSNDICLEIGSGKGLITTELLQHAHKVIAVELDQKLVLHLRRFLGRYPNFELHQADFLNFPLPQKPYKVFANIPFSIEGLIVRKLLDNLNSPEDSYLIVMKELAVRLSGLPHENQFSLKHKPWFEFSIYHKFKRSDFIPKPSVDCVLWRIKKREQPLLSTEEKYEWERFIEMGFGYGQNADQNLKKFLSPRQIAKISPQIGFSLKTKPGYLSLEQWLKLYKFINS